MSAEPFLPSIVIPAKAGIQCLSFPSTSTGINVSGSLLPQG